MIVVNEGSEEIGTKASTPLSTPCAGTMWILNTKRCAVRYGNGIEHTHEDEASRLSRNVCSEELGKRMSGGRVENDRLFPTTNG